jgi:hypothetical protein
MHVAKTNKVDKLSTEDHNTKVSTGMQAIVSG